MLARDLFMAAGFPAGVLDIVHGDKEAVDAILDHSIYGPEGVHFYTRLKTVTSHWPKGIRESVVFTFPSMKE